MFFFICVQISQCNQPDSDQSSIYNFTLLDISTTKNISLSDYRGKVSRSFVVIISAGISE